MSPQPLLARGVPMCVTWAEKLSASPAAKTRYCREPGSGSRDHFAQRDRGARLRVAQKEP